MERMMALEGIPAALAQHMFSGAIRRNSLLLANNSMNKSEISTAKLGSVIPVRAISSLETAQNFRTRRPENVEGEFYVDHKCIDCDTCRWMAPGNFSRMGKKSAVHKQPATQEERATMLQALLSCPTSSIHIERSSREILQVQATFPLEIDELPGVYHCGFHSKKSSGATPFLIKNPAGNILIDSPRYTDSLAHSIERLGGVRYMFITHIDDIADHENWRRRFLCDRVMHIGDIELDTLGVEMKLEGGGPWSLGQDIDLIYTPGHTAGSVCLLYKPLKALFTGDHVGFSSSGSLTIWPQYCKYSVKLQLESLSALIPLDFLWILPGHSRRIKFKDLKEKNTTLLRLLEENVLESAQ